MYILLGVGSEGGRNIWGLFYLALERKSLSLSSLLSSLSQSYVLLATTGFPSFSLLNNAQQLTCALLNYVPECSGVARLTRRLAPALFTKNFIYQKQMWQPVANSANQIALSLIFFLFLR